MALLREFPQAETEQEFKEPQFMRLLLVVFKRRESHCPNMTLY